jgi:ABC-type lipoprotein export system ATPase subunit
MAEPSAISWRGLSLPLSSGQKAFIPDFDLKIGAAALLIHHDPKLLNALANQCAALDSKLSGELLWREKPAPNLNRLWERLSFARTVGLLNKELNFLSGHTLFQILCLDLQYNQGADDQQAGEMAMEWLEKLDLKSQAHLDQSHFVGRMRSFALMALLMCRRPSLFILLKPLSLMGNSHFSHLWPILKSEAPDRGQAVLVLDQDSKIYPKSAFDFILDLDDDAVQTLKGD